MGTKPNIKTVYSLIAATIQLDPNTPAGKVIVPHIHSFACEKLKKENPNFKRLYSQVEEEGTPHLFSAVKVASEENYPEAFFAWLNNKHINWKNANEAKNIFVYSGNLQDPQSGTSFDWGVQIYLDMDD